MATIRSLLVAGILCRPVGNGFWNLNDGFLASMNVGEVKGVCKVRGRER